MSASGRPFREEGGFPEDPLFPEVPHALPYTSSRMKIARRWAIFKGADNGKYIAVDFSQGTDFPPVHANQMIVQYTEHEFIATFFELLPPVVNPDPAIQAQQLAQLTSIQARPVAKVVMSAARAREFVAAFAENLRKFDEDVRESAIEGAE